MTSHTPPEEMLVAYAAGTLPEPLAVLVAAHATLDPDSRREVEFAESVGGALLEDMEPEAMRPGALDDVLARLDADDAGAAAATPAGRGDVASEPAGTNVPAPLRRYVGPDYHALPWRERGGSVAEYRFLTDHDGYRTRLMRIRAGEKVPSHTHDGCEYTLVLEGGFSDANGEYFPGDLAIADAHVTHQPVAWRDRDCICLTVLDAPVRMTGPMGRFLNLFVDF